MDAADAPLVSCHVVSPYLEPELCSVNRDASAFVCERARVNARTLDHTISYGPAVTLHMGTEPFPAS